MTGQDLTLRPADFDLVGVDGRMTKNIIDVLARRGPADRKVLAAEIGVGRSTVSRAVGLLLDARMVIELINPPRGRGRPESLLAVNPQIASAIGLDFGLRHIRGAIVDAAHAILATAETRLPVDYTIDDALQSSIKLINDLAKHPTGPTIGIGLSLPGPIDRSQMTLTRSSILPGWAGAHVLEVFEKELGYPVVADNESNLAAYAEKLWGAATDIESMIYLKLHSGVGGAIMIRAQIVRGQHGAAGEFGHLSRKPRGAQCRCGRRGCLEASIGIPPLLAGLSAQHQRSLTFAELVALQQEGDPRCLTLIRSAGNEAGRAIGTLANALDPQAIVVGGALTEIGAPLLNAISAGMHASALPMHDSLPIRIAALGRFGSALGATGLVMASGFDRLLTQRWTGITPKRL